MIKSRFATASMTMAVLTAACVVATEPLVAPLPSTTGPPVTREASDAPTTAPPVATTVPAPTPLELPEPPEPRPTVRIVLAGDVMVGRGVAPVVRREGDGVFSGVAHVLQAADIAGGNLESPLTLRPHISPNPFALEADPAFAAVLAAAGFDVFSLANNHAGDAGRASITDSAEALESAGMLPVGGGVDSRAALAPVVIEHHGLSVGFLAFDATRAGFPAGPQAAGIAWWDEATAEPVVRALRREVDVVVVSVHGGVEYLTDNDPAMQGIATQLAGWGVDVVWGHGPHVVQPVYIESADRPGVVATSLGNFIFDQGTVPTSTGSLLEVTADARGVVAYRVGVATHFDRTVTFVGWQMPAGDVAHFGDSWWSITRTPEAVVLDRDVPLPDGEIHAAGVGDADGDGRPDLVVAVTDGSRVGPYAEEAWAAAAADDYLLVLRPGDHRVLWRSDPLEGPPASVTVCVGAVLAGDGRGRWDVWRWSGRTLRPVDSIDGGGSPGCADVDGDGRLDPIVLARP